MERHTEEFALLIAQTGPLNGQRWSLRKDLIVGREPSCDVVIPDRQVSRHHARFTFSSEGIFLEDLGSKNVKPFLVASFSKMEMSFKSHWRRNLSISALIPRFRSIPLGAILFQLPPLSPRWGSRSQAVGCGWRSVPGVSGSRPATEDNIPKKSRSYHRSPFHSIAC